MTLDRCIVGDCRVVMREMIAAGVKVQTCVTSPPYWGLRNYGVAGALGLERSPSRYLARMRSVFRLVWDLLADDGTLWLNMGDSYAGAPGGGQGKNGQRATRPFTGRIHLHKRGNGLKSKDLVGMPWMLALLLRADGWTLRRDIIWAKPCCMPEAVKDRPTTAHEYIFLLTKSPKYYYDAEAIKEPVTGNAHARGTGVNPKAALNRVPSGWDTGDGDHRQKRGRYSGTGVGFGHGYEDKPRYRARQNESFSAAVSGLVESRNKRSVWTVPPQPFAEAHFATFPEALIEPCVLAGSRPGDVVFDPFAGAGTTLRVASSLGRRFLGIEINPAYVEMQKPRTAQQGMPI